MSASMNATPWKSPIGRPNCSRSLAYAVAASSAACASPVAAAAIPSRPESRAAIAMAMPWPSSPTRRSASTGVPLKTTCRTVSQARPILRSGGANSIPAASAGTTKQDSPRLPSSEVRTNDV